MLGHEGMSSDETENEARGIVPKSVRRVPKVWLNEEISQMWEAVEIAGRPTSHTVGNHQVQRIFSASTTSRSRARAVCGLPANFYSDLWWKNLTESQQHFVNRGSEEWSIPSKVCVSLPNNTSFIHPIFRACLNYRVRISDYCIELYLHYDQ
jgi:hypothetical protein